MSDTPAKIQRVSFTEHSNNKDEIISFMAVKFEEIKRTLQEENCLFRGQLKVVTEALAEQKVVINQLLRQQADELPLRLNFPLNSEEELAQLNDKISEANKDSYIATMKIILQPAGVLKSMKCILADQLMMGFNVDGVQGKKSLKRFQHFYGALLESIPNSDASGSAEKQLREAIQLQKKRVFKSLSLQKSKTSQ